MSLDENLAQRPATASQDASPAAVLSPPRNPAIKVSPLQPHSQVPSPSTESDPLKLLNTVATPRNLHITQDLSDDESDFGSFDEAEFDPLPARVSPHDSLCFDDNVLADQHRFASMLSATLNTVFGEILASSHEPSSQILSMRAQEIYTELSAIPRLKPINWTRLRIRRDLLLRLGIPINLDEMAPKQKPADPVRPQSLPDDIDWQGLVIPSLAQLNINEDEHARLLLETNILLEKFTTDNLSHSSRQFLAEQLDDAGLDAKGAQLTLNFRTLVALASVWLDRLADLKKNYEMLETVIQNTTGYRQKLKRDELREQLKRRGNKRNSRLW